MGINLSEGHRSAGEKIVFLSYHTKNCSLNFCLALGSQWLPLFKLSENVYFALVNSKTVFIYEIVDL